VPDDSPIFELPPGAPDATALVAGIEDLLARYVGGTPYFDAFDDFVRAPAWFGLLLATAERSLGAAALENVVVSGQFGRAFAAWHDGVRSPIRHLLVAPGSLRHVTEFHFDPADAERARGRHFTFLDDSLYRGRTRGHIERALAESGGELGSTLVLYDGSRQVPRDTTGIYRYFDAHPESWPNEDAQEKRRPSAAAAAGEAAGSFAPA
jgi:hypothetical protein